MLYLASIEFNWLLGDCNGFLNWACAVLPTKRRVKRNMMVDFFILLEVLGYSCSLYSPEWATPLFLRSNTSPFEGR